MSDVVRATQENGQSMTVDDIMDQAKRDAKTQPGVEQVARLSDVEVFKVTYIKTKDHFECSRCVGTDGNVGEAPDSGVHSHKQPEQNEVVLAPPRSGMSIGAGQQWRDFTKVFSTKPADIDFTRLKEKLNISKA